jgi:peroxiredoxin (alkyl hydroperoxide reductase subunit C)
MPEEFKAGCQRPSVTTETVEEKTPETVETTLKEERQMIKVGKPAPDFTAPGFYQGKFSNFKLSEYLGQWVVLCFYPGDFTFV